MLDDGIIEPSYGPWSSPIVLVKKKSGEIRFCVDYRKLNAVTLPDCYPLPLIVDALDSLGGAKFFSTLDCQSGYWQIEVDPQDRVKTTFSSHCGNYHFTVLPFGVTNAPAFFQRTMDCILSGLTWKKCLIYIDDVIVFGKTVAEHNDNLADVFNKLEQAGLKLNPKKCHFFKTKVEYLGHFISSNGISPMPSKVKAVQDFPVPDNAKSVRSFLGLTSYYRRYIPNYATIASPLYNLYDKKKIYV
jgi:hypothetical protein